MSKIPTQKQLAYWESKKGKPSWNKGLPWSEEVKEKFRQKKLESPVKYWQGKKRPENSGEKNNMWQGGITSINASIRTSAEYKAWRTAVFLRDDFCCVMCGQVGYVEADHIKPFAAFPELRFNVDNGRTLCKPCHKMTDTYAGKGLKKSYNTNLKANIKSIDTNLIANVKSLDTNV